MTQRTKNVSGRESGKPVVGELDVVRLNTDAYEKEGLKRGEQGTVVLVHSGNGEKTYEVEFQYWEEKWPYKLKEVTSDEIEIVEKWSE